MRFGFLKEEDLGDSQSIRRTQTLQSNRRIVPSTNLARSNRQTAEQLGFRGSRRRRYDVFTRQEIECGIGIDGKTAQITGELMHH